MKTILLFIFGVTLSSICYAQSNWSLSMPVGGSTIHKPAGANVASQYHLGASVGLTAGFTLPIGESRWQIQTDLGTLYHGIRLSEPSSPQLGTINRFIFLGTLGVQLQRLVGPDKKWVLGVGTQPELFLAQSAEARFFDIEPPINIMGIGGLGYQISEHWSVTTQAHIGFTDIFNGDEPGFPPQDPDDFILEMRRYVLVVRYRF